MKANISIGECIVRIIIGMIFAAVMAGLFHNYVALIGLLAIYPLVTGMGGWDPIYAMRSKYTNEESPYEDHEPSSATAAPITRSSRQASSAA